MDDKTKGIYNKYRVERMDPSPKHENCVCFVLDMEHDPFAIPALAAYAKACRAEGFEVLADDLESYVEWKGMELNELTDQEAQEHSRGFKMLRDILVLRTAGYLKFTNKNVKALVDRFLKLRNDPTMDEARSAAKGEDE